MVEVGVTVARGEAHDGPGLALARRRCDPVSHGWSPRQADDRTRDELRLMDLREDEIEAHADDIEVERAPSPSWARSRPSALSAAATPAGVVAWFTNGDRKCMPSAQRLVAIDGNMVALKIAELVHDRLTELRALVALDPHGDDSQPALATSLALVPPAPPTDALGFTYRGRLRIYPGLNTPS